MSRTNEIIRIFMVRDELSYDEAVEIFREMRRDVLEFGADPEEVLHDQGLEPDYIWELI